MAQHKQKALFSLWSLKQNMFQKLKGLKEMPLNPKYFEINNQYKNNKSNLNIESGNLVGSSDPYQ